MRYRLNILVISRFVKLRNAFSIIINLQLPAAVVPFRVPSADYDRRKGLSDGYFLLLLTLCFQEDEAFFPP